ncbi:MAG: class I SAM-dependent methyltransferase [Bacteroidota bacterium]
MSSERLLHFHASPWWAEHVHRYREVLSVLTGVERVLDLACGTGYGTAVLAERAAEVIGGDVDVEAIESIDSSFRENPKVRFEVMDGTKLPFSDARFDVVVSFETIEHTRDYEAMLDEFRRVLKPGGLFFCFITQQAGPKPRWHHKQPISYAGVYPRRIQGTFR